MTRKQAHELLDRMRSTGRIAKVEHSYEEEEKNYPPSWARCMSKTAIRYFRAGDEYIYAVGAGSWACRNSYAEFYQQVKYSKLLELEPAGKFHWGL